MQACKACTSAGCQHQLADACCAAAGRQLHSCAAPHRALFFCTWVAWPQEPGCAGQGSGAERGVRCRPHLHQAGGGPDQLPAAAEHHLLHPHAERPQRLLLHGAQRLSVAGRWVQRLGGACADRGAGTAVTCLTTWHGRRPRLTRWQRLQGFYVTDRNSSSGILRTACTQRPPTTGPPAQRVWLALLPCGVAWCRAPASTAAAQSCGWCCMQALTAALE